MNEDNPLFPVTKKPNYSIGTRRVWWHDGHDSWGASWQCRVSVNVRRGSITVQAGPMPGDSYGQWPGSPQTTHMCDGYEAKYLIEFARYVQGVVNDPLIVPAVEHLIACQQQTEVILAFRDRILETWS